MPKQKRHSPSQFRSRAAAVVVFVLLMALLAGAAALGYMMLTQYDYSGFLPTDGTMRDFLPEEGYVAATPAPMQTATVAPVPALTPQPTLRPTPIPLELYSMRNTRVLMAEDDGQGNVRLTDYRVSEPDDNQVLVVRGWGYMTGRDAANSEIYLAVSTKNGYNHRFYNAIVQSGSTGIEHDPETGKNLDRADFVAAFSVDTYSDGEYKLGLLIYNHDERKNVRKAYYPLGGSYNFTVAGGKIAYTNMG